MKFINYILAFYVLNYGALMTFKVVPLDYFFLGCVTLISSLKLFGDALFYKKLK